MKSILKKYRLYSTFDELKDILNIAKTVKEMFSKDYTRYEIEYGERNLNVKSKRNRNGDLCFGF